MLKISPLVATIFRSFSGNETSNWGDWAGGRVVTYWTFMPDCWGLNFEYIPVGKKKFVYI